MSKLSFKNFCAVFMAIAFILFAIGSPSEVHAQSQEKLEKTNSISNLLVVGALVLVAVAVIVTVSKGAKKGKDEGAKEDTAAQELRQYSEGQERLESSSSDIKAFALSEYEAAEVVDWRPENGSAAPVQSAFLRHGCFKFADDME